MSGLAQNRRGREVIRYGLRLFSQRQEGIEADLRLAEQYAHFQTAYMASLTRSPSWRGRLRGGRWPSIEFHAVYYATAGRRYDAADTLVLNAERADGVEDVDGLGERLMLVGIPEFLQDRQRVAWRVVPSFVRLLAPDEPLGVLRNPGEHRLLPGYRPLIEVPLSQRDRELVVLAGDSTVCENELPDQMVERGADVVDVLTGDHPDFDRRWLPSPDAKHGPAGLRLFVVDEFVGLILAPKLDAVFDRMSVSVRSTKLGPDAV